jgi:hypothetical protein
LHQARLGFNLVSSSDVKRPFSSIFLTSQILLLPFLARLPLAESFGLVKSIFVFPIRRVIGLPESFPHVYALRMTSPRYFVLFWLALMVSVANVSAQSTSTRRMEASAQTHDFSSLGWADSFQHLQQTMSREHASSFKGNTDYLGKGSPQMCPQQCAQKEPLSSCVSLRMAPCGFSQSAPKSDKLT